jgi:hypothetical protein
LFSNQGQYLFSGGGWGKLEQDNLGNWTPSDSIFQFELYSAWEAPLPGVSDVRSAKITIRDSNGYVVESFNIRVENGIPYWLPYYSQANGQLEVTYTDGSTFVYSLNNGGQKMDKIVVSGMPSVKVAGLVTLARNTNQATVVVYADGNYGDTSPLFMEEVTSAQWVLVKASTTDGQLAEGVWVRKTSGGKPTWYSTNGASEVWVFLPEAGHWYMVPQWKKFGHPIFDYYGGGKGKSEG